MHSGGLVDEEAFLAAWDDAWVIMIRERDFGFDPLQRRQWEWAAKCAKHEYLAAWLDIPTPIGRLVASLEPVFATTSDCDNEDIVGRIIA